MSKVIPGVPESITRDAYIKLIEASGLDPVDIKELMFCADGIYATVFARDENGARVIDPIQGPMNNAIYIPVEDDK